MDPPYGCTHEGKKDMIDQKRADFRQHRIKIILIVIGILVIFFVVIIVVYKRMARKMMSREMDTQVNEMVSQYIAFYDKDKSTKV